MIKKSATYFLGNLLASLIGFGGLMVITRLITPSDYGIFSYVYALTLMAYPLFFTWLRFAILREQSADRNLDLRKTIVLALILILPLIIAAVSLAYLYSIDLKGYYLLLILMIFFTGLYEIVLEFMRAHQKEKHYAVIVVSRSLIYILTALACYHFFPNHALGLVIAFCLSYFIVIIMGFTVFF
jgi:O-antigen/teichoic acid export membrane protein